MSTNTLRRTSDVNVFVINAPGYQAALTRSGGQASKALRHGIITGLKAQNSAIVVEDLEFKRGASGKWYVRTVRQSLSRMAQSCRAMVTGADVRWHAQYANTPDVVVLARDLPTLEDFEFEAVVTSPGRTAYRGTCGQHVRFFFHDTANEHGFGGRRFTLSMSDGTQRTIKGPWSSNSHAINDVFSHREPVMEVTFLEDGHTCGLAGAMTTSAVRTIMATYLPDVPFVDAGDGTFGIPKSATPADAK